MNARKSVREKCGCRVERGERERFVEMCPEHESAWMEIHARWAAERPALMAEFSRPRKAS